jgi:HPt (histidine-containing phosphotransfer) domain-containing protein
MIFGAVRQGGLDLDQELEMTVGPSVPPDRGMRGIPAIDRSVLGEWLAGDKAAIDEFLVVFRDSVRAELARMHDVLDRGRLDEFAGAAHRLRGAALSMGARALADFVGRLFAAARAQDAKACVEGMRELEAQVRLMVAEVPEGAGPTGGGVRGGNGGPSTPS